METEIPRPLVDLARLIVRTFYEDKYVIFMDMLTRERMLSEDMICNWTKLASKDVNKLLSRLKDDRLIQMQVKTDSRVNDWERPATKNHYYIDYKQFSNLVKYKMYKMRQLIESSSKTRLDDKGYKCTSCDTHYSLLDAQKLVDWSTSLFLCEHCGNELIATELSEGQPSENDLSKFMKQCAPIIDLLKEIDKLAIPSFVPLDYQTLQKNIDVVSDSHFGVIKTTISIDLPDTHVVDEDTFDVWEDPNEGVSTEPLPSKEEKTVMVQGMPIKLSQLTDEDRDKMTLEEYKVEIGCC